MLGACGGGGGGGSADDGTGGSGGPGNPGGSGDPPQVSITGGGIGEGDSGTASLVFAVALSSAASADVTVDYVTEEGSATADDDYAHAEDTLTIPAGQLQANLAVTINGDTCFEEDETFSVRLTGVSSNAVLDTALATGTIRNDDNQPVLTVADAEIDEGDDGFTDMPFAITLDRPTCVAVTGTWTTNSVTADEQDLTIATGPFEIAAGSDAGEILVAIAGDEIYETDETFTLNLENVSSHAVVADGEAFGTIRTDDFPPVTVNEAELAEGDSGTRTLVFPVELAGPTNEISVEYATSDLSATAADQDYVAAQGTLTVPAGVTSATIEVEIVGDTRPELTEEFLVRLTAVDGDAVLVPGTDQAKGRILDDDTVVVLDPEISVPPAFGFEEGDEADDVSELEFQVTLNVPVATPLELRFETADGSATAGSDYDAADGIVTIPAGGLFAIVPVTIHGDAEEEGPEQLTLELELLTPGIATLLTPQVTGTIIDDDVEGPPFLSVQPVEIFEGDDGTRDVTVFVTLGGPATDTVSVGYATRDLTALAGSDYAATSGTLSFPPGETVQTFTVTIFGDTVVEGDERFEVVLSNMTGNAIMFDDVAEATIRTDDPLAMVSIGDVVLVEGDSGVSPMRFIVRLSAPAADPVTMEYASADATAGNSATANEDYVPVSGVLTFLPGETEASIDVEVLGDVDNEFDETFTITLSNVSQNAELADPVAEGHIVNDDETPGWQLADYFVSTRDDNVLPRIAMNAAGDATVVWAPIGPVGPYTSVRYTAGGGWGAPENPPEALVAGLVRNDRDHVIDGAGRTTLAWAMMPEAARHSAADGWDTAPAVLVPTSTNDAEFVRVAGNEAGTVLAVWKFNDPAGVSIDHLMFSFYDPAAGAWGTPDYIVLQGAPILLPDVAMNEDGAAVVVWQESSVRASVYDPVAGTWSAPVEISAELIPGIHQAGYTPRVAIDADGNAIAVWDSGQSLGTATIGDVWTARYDAASGLWSEATPLDASALDATNPQVAMDAAGNAFVVWLQDNDGTDPWNDTFDIRARRYDAAADAWEPIVLVQDSNTRVSGTAVDLTYYAVDMPALAVDPAGNAILAWSEEINGDFVIRASRYDRTAAQPGWSAPEPVSDDTYPFAMFPDIAIDAAGNAIVVWQAGDSDQFDTGNVSAIGWNRYVAP